MKKKNKNIQKIIPYMILLLIAGAFLLPLLWLVFATPGTPGLLIIALHVLRHVIMHHKPHIGLVDPHTEGIGCHNDLIFIIYKIILVSFSLRVPQSRMIPGHGKSVTAELFTDLLHSLSGQTVHNSAVIRMQRCNKADPNPNRWLW